MYMRLTYFWINKSYLLVLKRYDNVSPKDLFICVLNIKDSVIQLFVISVEVKNSCCENPLFV